MDRIGKEWYAAVSLLLQAGFLMALVWSVRAILKAMRASQEQMGALVKLTLSGVREDEDLRAATRPAAHLLDGGPEEERHRTGPWTSVLRWLRTPAASSGAGSWRKMVRWLQAPAGS